MASKLLARGNVLIDLHTLFKLKYTDRQWCNSVELILEKCSASYSATDFSSFGLLNLFISVVLVTVADLTKGKTGVA